MSQRKPLEMIFWCSVPGVICCVPLSFRRLAISATRFLVVFSHFQIHKICRSSTYHCDLIKETIIKKF